MKILKKAAAALLAVCTAFTCASCGEDTANAMTVDGYDVRAGIYLYYATSAYTEAMSVLRDGGQNFDDVKETKEIKKVMQDATIDEVDAETWIQNKAAQHCADFVQVEREFEALGLTLSGQELAAIKNETASNMNYYGDFYKSAGIGEQSVRDIVANNYKQNAIWEAYYGDEGSVGVKQEDMQDYYAENHLRLKYIEMPLKDGEGNLLKADGKKEIEKMADDFMKRLAKKDGSEAELMNEMDFLIEENANYQTSISEAAVTTTDDEGNTITTATTAKVTTNEKGETDTTSAEDGETTTETTVTTTAADDADGDTTETTTTVEVTTETTDTTAGADETTTTTASTTLTYSFQYEHTLQVSTTATKKADEKEADTTTTEPYYTPCKAVYDWAADEDTPLLKPEKILSDDEETIYIVVKLDIRERINEDDIWTDSVKESVRTEMYNDEFQDMMREKADALPAKRNEKAFKRYKVLDLDIIGYQNALMSYYYSMYGGYGG